MEKRHQKLIGKNNSLLILLVVVICISAGVLAVNLINSFSFLNSEEIFSSVVVSDHYGFDLNETALTFGMVNPGGSSKRDLEIRNDYGRDVKISIGFKGEIRRFISVSENPFVLNPNHVKNISFSVNIPYETEYGTYSGFVIIETKKVI